MKLDNSFRDFLKDIRLGDPHARDCQEAHHTLRERLVADETLGAIILGTFLQGSYVRATAVRPMATTDRADVDLVVVTNLDHEASTPQRVLDELLTPFLDTYYPGLWEPHDRSVKLQVPGTQVELDLVLTAAPSEAQRQIIESDAASKSWTLDEAEDWKLNPKWVAPPKRSGLDFIVRQLREAAVEPEWKSEPLLIPSRDLARWVETDPLAQIKWTRDKNGRTGGHYVNVVKAIKWWRVRNNDPKYPKGYPLEHLIGQTCPDETGSVAEGIVSALETIRDFYPSKPYMKDHGVEQDVFRRVSTEDYAGFHRLVTNAADLARRALAATTLPESADLWRELLGPEFPAPPDDERAFTQRRDPSTVGTGGRFGGRHG
jgi:hypothetical protein